MPKISFQEREIKSRLTLTRALKETERRDGRLNVGCGTLKDFVDDEDSIEIIIVKGGAQKA